MKVSAIENLSAFRSEEASANTMAERNHGQMLLAMQADEAKRARQREHVKNSYYRQQARTNAAVNTVSVSAKPSFVCLPECDEGFAPQGL